MNKIKKIIRKLIDCFNKCFSLIFYVCPVKKNKVTFCNFAGKGYGCNLKYLAEELKKENKYKLVWFVKDLKDESIPKEIKKIKYGSLKHYYHMITAKLWIDNIRNSVKPIFKRKKQIYIQSWHGGLVLKGVEKDAENSLSKRYIKKAKQDSLFANYMLSNCKKRSELIKRAFWFDGDILEYGVPRDDVLFIPNQKEINDLKAKYGLEGKKIVLYAPSFRNDKDFYKNLKFNVNNLVDSLNKKFGDEFELCLRLHPNDDNITSLEDFKNVKNLTKESDSQLVLSASDIVISDYSSMLLDFILTKRPTFCFAPDYDSYIKKERNLYIDIAESGIPFSKSFDELLANVKKFDNNKYLKEIDKLLDFYGLFENGNSSRLILEHLKNKGEL